MKRLIVATALAVAVSVAAGQALAADYKVFLGEQVPCGFAKIPGCPAGIPKQTTLDEFFPSKVTINAGDTITFSSAIFHSAAYGLKQPDFILADPKQAKYTALADAAGKPFHFCAARARAGELHRAGSGTVEPECPCQGRAARPCPAKRRHRVRVGGAGARAPGRCCSATSASASPGGRSPAGGRTRRRRERSRCRSGRDASAWWSAPARAGPTASRAPSSSSVRGSPRAVDAAGRL